MKVHEFYQDKLANQDSEFKKVGWDNEQKAIERYQFANKLIAKNQCKSILDVGCGLGTLSKFLNLRTKYYGVDRFSQYIIDADIKRGQVISGNVRIAYDHWHGFDGYVSLGVYTLMDNPDDYELCFNDYMSDILFMLRTDKKCTIINTFHDVHDYSDPKLFYPKLNHIVGLGQKVADTHSLSLHIFKKYEVFAEFVRHK